LFLTLIFLISPANGADKYNGLDKEYILTYVEKEFALLSGKPLLKANIVSNYWNKYSEWRLKNSVFEKVEYAVIKVNTISELPDSHAEEHQIKR